MQAIDGTNQTRSFDTKKEIHMEHNSLAAKPTLLSTAAIYLLFVVAVMYPFPTLAHEAEKENIQVLYPMPGEMLDLDVSAFPSW